MSVCKECGGNFGRVVLRPITRTDPHALKAAWKFPGKARLRIECFKCGGWGDDAPDDPNRLAISIDTERPRR